MAIWMKVGQASIVEGDGVFCRSSAVRAGPGGGDQKTGSVSGAWSRKAFLAVWNSGKIDCTVAQKRGL